ncbi:hypothetical protein IIA79_06060, partial [bacterium]|nr:hypothetical protein [bacterium]
VIEPALFYDLALLPPEEFIITFMTGTTGINLDDNVELLGEIRDFLVRPFNVPMAVGHFDNEQLNPLAGFESPLPSEDIVSWFVEVN